MKKLFGIKSSTVEFYKTAKKEKNYSFGKWLHGYIYGRWIYLYIGIGTGEHFIARTFAPLTRLIVSLFQPSKDTGSKTTSSIADHYHGKVVSLESARQFVNINKKIEIRDLEKIIPYPCARDIVLKNPDHIVVMECPCRSSKPNPCLPLDVCLVIGDPFASFILEHHPGKTRRITSLEAENILEQAHLRNNVHHAFFKEEMIGRFYAICNCCSCCCGAINAMKHGTPMLAPSGYRVRKTDDCVGCGLCVDACQFDALEFVGKELHVNEKCMGCGTCVSVCHKHALILERDSSNGEPLEIKELMKDAEQQGAFEELGRKMKQRAE